MKELEVRMLGSFSLETGGHRITDAENRSQKPWLLMAYLLCHRGRTVSQEELIRMCWEPEEIKGDPANALRVVLHRARAMLDKLEVVTGRDLLVRSRDGFEWGDRLSVWTDVEEFESLYGEGCANADQKFKLQCFKRAISLYGGDFLSRNTGDGWAGCMAERLRRMYLDMAEQAVELYSGDGQLERGAQLCREVLNVLPGHEGMYRRLMETLLELGQAEQAVEVYEKLRVECLETLDRLPERKTRQIYYRALQASNGDGIPVRLHPGDGCEAGGPPGAKVCDFTFFQLFYPSAEWLVEQCGVEMYNTLFTLELEQARPVSQRTRERLMEHLCRQLRMEVGRSGTLTQCDEARFLAIVRIDGYENTCLFCERQVETFYRNHPNTPHRLRYGVWRMGKFPNE